MKIELCAASVESIDLAVKYKLDRIELCQSLESGGVTPSLGLIEKAISSGMETHVLIRPRIGNFYYNDNEKETMLKDISFCRSIGVKGVVVGALDKDRNVDESFLFQVLDKVGEMDITFHRAIDECVSWKKAIDSLITLNFKRILTSGQAIDVSKGLKNIEQMVNYSQGQIEIMAGGGVNESNIQDLIQIAKVNAIHFSGTELITDDKSSLFGGDRLVVSENKLKQLMAFKFD
jgi:copper homeostasis protein